MNLAQRDQAVIWHPYTQHRGASLPIPIARGEGAYLIDTNGKRYLDLVSSWFLNLHGHSHPKIAEAIYQQALTMEQVMFAGFTHEPAVKLAEELLKLLPSAFSKIFYSDNGSTAVEVALKMAYQYWYNQGEKKRTRFLAFENSYHGDTFGAMAVGKLGFFSPYEDLFFEVKTFPYPGTWLGDSLVAAREQTILNQLAEYLESAGEEIAAFIIEPLIQGVGGMHMCRPQFLQALEKLLRSYGILIIYDEVMTGFGRTGDVFACVKANTQPDIICFAKGLTGGFLPLAVTACQEKIYEAFLGQDARTALLHGHSFTANPLGCAAALASLELFLMPETKANMAMIENVHRKMAQEFADDLPITKYRYCGTISAFDLTLPVEYGSSLSVKLREACLEQGFIIRPFGKVIYLMPPYCVTEEELKQAYTVFAKEIQGVIA